MDLFGTNNPGYILLQFTDEEVDFLAGLAALGDPGGDRILGWDETDNAPAYFVIGSGLSYNHASHTLSATGGSGGGYTVTTVTGATHNESATEGTAVILCDATVQNITVNLPTAVGNGATIVVKKIDSSANTVTINGDGSETIDDGATAVIRAQYASVDLISDNSNWNIT